MKPKQPMAQNSVIHPDSHINLASLAHVLGTRSLLVLSEIEGCLEVNGMAKVYWPAFRRSSGMAAPNLYRILVKLEHDGVICRDTTKSFTTLSWAYLWVNPEIILHGRARQAYMYNLIRGYQRKRANLAEAIARPKSMPENPDSSLEES